MKKVSFKEFKGLSVYKEVLELYNIKLESLEKCVCPSTLYETCGSIDLLENRVDYEQTLKFAKRHKKAVFEHYKKERDELDKDYCNEWLNKEKGLDITDLVMGTKEQQDDILFYLALALIRDIAMLIFDSIDSETDDKLKALIEKIEQEN